MAAVGNPRTAVRPRYAAHAGLLALTLLTTLWAGGMHQGVNVLANPSAWAVGLPYAMALLAILGVHEMGHYLVARRRGVNVSLPYFIPAPSWLGTFGAFITMRGPIRSRIDYFDVGIAGPISGLAIALAALFYGLQSEITVMAHGSGLTPASSVLLAVVYTLGGGTDLTATLQLGPVGFAGWLGLIITALNLLPVGQLDGGHVAYAMLGERSARGLSRVFVGLLIVGGLMLGSHFWMWGVVAWLIAGTGHPPAATSTPIGPGRMLLGAFSLVLLLAILLPMPGL